MLYEYLKQHYEDGEPIFLDDIHIEGMKRDNFRQQIKTLADAGKIVRYEKGIYYIPKKTRFSSSAGSTSETVARYKYISRGGRTYTDYNIWEPKFKCISVPSQESITNFSRKMKLLHCWYPTSEHN